MFASVFIPIGLSILAVSVLQFFTFEEFSDIGKSFVLVFLGYICLKLGWHVGIRALCYFPNGIALELHQGHIIICKPFGRISILRNEIRGCKIPVKLERGIFLACDEKSGMVEISVTDKHRLRNLFGKARNPSFYAPSVIGEDGNSIVGKLRAWEKHSD